jgi:hypothetical protein
MMAEAGPDRGCMLLIHGDAEARRRYDEHVAAAAPRGVLLPALRRRPAGRAVARCCSRPGGKTS